MENIWQLVLAVLACGVGANCAPAPVAQWSFEQKTAGAQEALKGSAGYAAGVHGKCLVLDGLTTFVARTAGHEPKLKDAFTVEAWVALGAYPLWQTPIVDLATPDKCGLLLALDAHGRPVLGVQAGGKWQSVTAQQVIPLRQWHHLAGVLEAGGVLRLYLDGRQLAEQRVEGALVPPENVELLIGRSRTQQKPEGTIRPKSTGAIFDFLDGALDEVKLFDRALGSEEIAAAVKSISVPAECPLPPRVLPAGPAGVGPFGAFYTHLKFYPQWDHPWRVGEQSDVVVRFEDLPVRFVFWRGTSYIPHWVTENGIWFDNEFTETWAGVQGCGEPMSDKQCRYSHVRVLESSAARAVVHWRYALADVFYALARVDPQTGWGDWTDELYTIYPDGTSVRQVTLHSTNPEQPHEWQESIVVMGPGFSPENSIEPGGVTLVNAAGESATYSWKDATPPKRPGKPAAPCIQLINTKSRFKPFSILRPEDQPEFDVYAGEIRRDVTMYPWWNHWPAATYPSDGRYAMAADRPSHSSLTHLFWKPYRQGHQWMQKIMLAGLTEQPAEKLLPLMRSWSKPAEFKLAGVGAESEGYDQAQKAYVLNCAKLGAQLAFTLAASADSPVLNPAFVVKNWGEANAKLTLNGQAMPRGKAVRYGHRRTLDGTDLIVWLQADATAPVELVLTPQ